MSATQRSQPSTVLLVAAGDIACGPNTDQQSDSENDQTGCRQKATSDLVGSLHPNAVMPLGDLQYQRATYDGFEDFYAPTWGRYLSITHPVIGNHEYLTTYANAYFAYFGPAAGDPTKGYYSFSLGQWHVIVLNSECRFILGGCGIGSPQENWLKADLAAHRTLCTLAAWHEPRWSSGDHGVNDATDTFMRDLYAAGAEVVLAGHDHDYERFAPLDPNGSVDNARGIREFVVGTGGVGLRPFKSDAYGSEVRQNTTFGVLALTLKSAEFDWRFVSERSNFEDVGRDSCH